MPHSHSGEKVIERRRRAAELVPAPPWQDVCHRGRQHRRPCQGRGQVDDLPRKALHDGREVHPLCACRERCRSAIARLGGVRCRSGRAPGTEPSGPSLVCDLISPGFLIPFWCRPGIRNGPLGQLLDCNTKTSPLGPGGARKPSDLYTTSSHSAGGGRPAAASQPAAPPLVWCTPTSPTGGDAQQGSGEYSRLQSDSAKKLSGAGQIFAVLGDIADVANFARQVGFGLVCVADGLFSPMVTIRGVSSAPGPTLTCEVDTQTNNDLPGSLPGAAVYEALACVVDAEATLRGEWGVCPLGHPLVWSSVCRSWLSLVDRLLVFSSLDGGWRDFFDGDLPAQCGVAAAAIAWAHLFSPSVGDRVRILRKVASNNSDQLLLPWT
mmetsp:Transcript_31838/g.105548  ORF Transcript_31838/g.105548 Transcript_31838/m.105548 type:complete len:379 (+) Transcript_31838:77-1213(+)